MSVISTQRIGDILVIVSNNPPVNALGQAVRAGLAEAIAHATAEPAIRAVIIRCDGRTFFAGADITEFGKPPLGPSLPDVVDAIEQCSKPVVAAIHGTALGGGLELALACHYRIAIPSARLGLPEVKLGLLPGAGGTQRLPRVIGVAAALSMIVTGDPVMAARALEIGLLDRIAQEGALVDDALILAAEMAQGAGHPVSSLRTDRIAETANHLQVFDKFIAENSRRLKGFDAPKACIEAVRAAVELPFDQGIKRERELFMKLVSGTQSKAMRHLFFAERLAAKIDGIPADTSLIDIAKVGILGAGTMGGGIAMNFLSAGLPVTMVEREQAALDRGVATIRKNYERSAARGRLTGEQVEQAMALLKPTLDYDDLADCDLVIEAVFELMEIKKDVFRRLDAIVKPGAILASNTSYLNIDEMAAETRRPEAVLGLHFFSPANIMRLLEVVRGAKTSPSVLKTVMALAKRIGKIAVVSGVGPGFIGNRMLTPRQREAQKLLLEGATPWEVDAALTEFGFPMGPFQMADLAGLDLGWTAEGSTSSTIREVLCERGRRGQKSSKGFYDYDESRRGAPSPETEAIIADFAARSGSPQRKFSADEIRERLLYPMINEGAKILEEGMAQRPSDIDIVWLNGYGWPAFTGGPMFWADTIGLKTVLDGLHRHADALGPEFEISAGLMRKVETGESFN